MSRIDEVLEIISEGRAAGAPDSQIYMVLQVVIIKDAFQTVKPSPKARIVGFVGPTTK
jgi:hypothetical protein